MSETQEWPGHWTRVAPRVEDHPQGAELAWIARGYPFNRPVLARSNVGVKRAPAWVAMEPQYEQFVRVELMADGFHGQDVSVFGWFRDLEWLGPLVLPNVLGNLPAEKEIQTGGDTAERASWPSWRMLPLGPNVRGEATKEAPRHDRSEET
jgi:hypothetical protein